MAGYSGTPLARKLGVREGHVVLLVGRPEGWTVDDLPSGAVLTEDRSAGGDVVVAFFRRAADIGPRLPDLGRLVFPDRSLWAAWPRRAAGHVSDVTEQAVRDVALPLGLVDVKVAALGEDWSGLKLMWRRDRR